MDGEGTEKETADRYIEIDRQIDRERERGITEKNWKIIF